MIKQPVMRKELLTAKIHGGKPVARVEIQQVTMDVGAEAPLHLHPCPTVGIVVEGEIVFEIEGAQPRMLKVGDAFYEPADVRVAKFVAFYLLGEDDTQTVRILEK